MERQRKRKFIIMIALMVAISAMSLGFAAFSATLNISSSASVTPSSGDFLLKIKQSSTQTLSELKMIGYNGAVPASIIQYAPLASFNNFPLRISGTFTEPGQYIEIPFEIVNAGAYDAYLKGITFNYIDGTSSIRQCTASGDNPGTQTLIDAACDDFYIEISVGEDVLNESNSFANGHVFSIGETEAVSIKLIYDENGDRVDGEFSVEFGSVTMEFSTVDNEVITFYVEHEATGETVTYSAFNGMTWNNYLNSSSFTGDFFYSDGIICSYSGYIAVRLNNLAVNSNDKIISGATYYAPKP